MSNSTFVSGPTASKRFFSKDLEQYENVLSEQQRIQLKPKKGTIYCKTAGQDTVIRCELFEKDSQLDSIYGVLDGHGSNGHYYSFIASRLIVSGFLNVWSELRNSLFDYTMHHDTNTINKIINSVYSETNALLTTEYFPYLTGCSGTTASIVLVCIVNNKRYLITTNVGDSPVIVNNECCSKLSVDDNCDNIMAVNSYLSNLNSYNNTNATSIKPLPIYYSRINCEGYGNPVWPQITDMYGILEPLEVYKYNNNNTKASINMESYERISKYYPHGSQSRNSPPTYIRSDGRLVVKSGYEGQNWGNSLNGGNQCLTGLGDYDSTPHISCKPNINISSLNSGHLLICSDGLYDLFRSDEDLIEFFIKNNSNNSLEQNTKSHIFSIVKDDPLYSSCIVDGEEMAEWDDWCGNFIEFSPIITDYEREPEYKVVINGTDSVTLEEIPSPKKGWGSPLVKISKPTFNKKPECQYNVSCDGVGDNVWVLDKWTSKNKNHIQWRKSKIVSIEKPRKDLQAKIKIHYMGWKPEYDCTLDLNIKSDRERFISDSSLLTTIQLDESVVLKYSKIAYNGEQRYSGPILNDKMEQYLKGFLSIEQIRSCRYNTRNDTFNHITHPYNNENDYSSEDYIYSDTHTMDDISDMEDTTENNEKSNEDDKENSEYSEEIINLEDFSDRDSDSEEDKEDSEDSDYKEESEEDKEDSEDSDYKEESEEDKEDSEDSDYKEESEEDKEDSEDSDYKEESEEDKEDSEDSDYKEESEEDKEDSEDSDYKEESEEDKEDSEDSDYKEESEEDKEDSEDSDYKEESEEDKEDSEDSDYKEESEEDKEDSEDSDYKEESEEDKEDSEDSDYKEESEEDKEDSCDYKYINNSYDYGEFVDIIKKDNEVDSCEYSYTESETESDNENAVTNSKDLISYTFSKNEIINKNRQERLKKFALDLFNDI